MIPRIADGDLAIVIDCGYDDFFFGVNNDFHAELLRRGKMCIRDSYNTELMPSKQILIRPIFGVHFIVRRLVSLSLSFCLPCFFLPWLFLFAGRRSCNFFHAVFVGRQAS